ncbi:hypothetical protein PS645_04211 [Pseudomonas fluorescens]|uniref:Uncharacterized protein n=1 Tax=Pseudomonas fluorescens TaxID=294 RepID=A0A5E6VND4_PSEFL|nr:hypothetical protein [Pseudomonas fluorescens]VVN19203.1 hypothetical protein PS645_04211 [Pseudomonas fluorescens]
MKDDLATSSDNQSALHAGPATRLIISGAGNPNNVRRGSNFEKFPSGTLQDASGREVIDTGRYTLLSVTPSSDTAKVTVTNTPGRLNGSVKVTNVQNDMTIVARLTPDNHPHLAANYTVIVKVIG